ncbi:MAG: hypothetical protein AABW93_00660 [Nanoarchaeota archaeon]
MTNKPMYAYATRREQDGVLVIYHEEDKNSKKINHYVIPVSSDKGFITMHRHGGELESTLIDIQPLVEAGVIPEDRVKVLR